jgi:hypothetical protein
MNHLANVDLESHTRVVKGRKPRYDVAGCVTRSDPTGEQAFDKWACGMENPFSRGEDAIGRDLPVFADFGLMKEAPARAFHRAIAACAGCRPIAHRAGAAEKSCRAALRLPRSLMILRGVMRWDL